MAPTLACPLPDASRVLSQVPSPRLLPSPLKDCGKGPQAPSASEGPAPGLYVLHGAAALGPSAAEGPALTLLLA